MKRDAANKEDTESRLGDLTVSETSRKMAETTLSKCGDVSKEPSKQG